VWAELLVLLAEGEMEEEPWDETRYRAHRSAVLQAGTDNICSAAEQQQAEALLETKYRGSVVVRKVVQVS
jgi:hypothetical protein